METNFKFNTVSKELLGDFHTPVSLYLKLRDMYPMSALLESSDFHGRENSRSFIAVCPMASFAVNGSKATLSMPDNSVENVDVTAENSVTDIMNSFLGRFDIEGENTEYCGMYGYTAFDSVRYFENIPVMDFHHQKSDAPDMLYVMYRYLLIFDHFKNQLTLVEVCPEGEQSKITDIEKRIDDRNFASYDFKAIGESRSTITDEQYVEMVEQGVKHCLRGDVFQIVLSRRFEQSYSGDDFKVYRTLRNINPSPYLFYFDFGNFRIFGSSPETHCKVENGRASIDPIAGTAFRTGDPIVDKQRTDALVADPKENAEHVMLVDLARNDLSRNAFDVKLDFYKEVQHYSHVVHLVSRVSGTLNEGSNPIKSFIDTFPAGTLSGAPKVRAMELITELEPHNRGAYGGCIGLIGFDGRINQAITIRTFVSRAGVLQYQAGAGVVAKSNPQRELQEVNSKLGALTKAIKRAETIIN